jgi:uncharacterized protein YprB with RNaseH-like and TPR domain
LEKEKNLNPAPTKLYTILKKLTKQEILKYSNKTCEHGHPLLSHPNCLAKRIGSEEQIGILDIETSNFNATFGVVVTWCIKRKGGEILEAHLEGDDFEDKQGFYDKRILQECVEAMQEFDRIVVYWGKDRRFDIPFLRTRAAMMGVRFPIYQENLVFDMYDVVKNKFRFGRNSLASACKALKIEAKETDISPDMWVKATIGRDTQSMNYILQHNREDVVSTEKLWDELTRYTNIPNTSI